MPLFSTVDLVALAWFIGAWAIYSAILSLTEKRRQGLNSEMNRYRDVWMFQMLGREMRMVDAQIVAALQNGTAFFASTSLIAIGGALTLLRSSDAILEVVAALPIGVKMTLCNGRRRRSGSPSSSSTRSSSSAGPTGSTITLRSWSAPRHPPRTRTRPRPRLMPSGSDGCAKSPACTSTAASARSFSRSAISAGLSARGC